MLQLYSVPSSDCHSALRELLFLKATVEPEVADWAS